MMLGNENSAEDNAVLVRAVDTIKAACEGNVSLVDHTGVHDDTRARGGNSVLAAMDTEVRVARNDGGGFSAEITRDKAAGIGASWCYRLDSVPDTPGLGPDEPVPAVCVPATASAVLSTPFGGATDWNLDATPLPADVVSYTGRGAGAVPALARFMRHQASGGVGFTLAAARKAVLSKMRTEQGKPKWSEDTVDRAWGALVDLGRIDPADGTNATGRSLWKARPGEPT
jgi:hypothetical protein